MVQWEVLVVLVIALGVWIVSTLFKTDETPKGQQQPRRPGGGPGYSSSSRPPVTDLNQFLADARRRREDGEGRRMPAPAPQPRPAPRAVAQPARSRPPGTQPSRQRPKPSPVPVPVQVLPDPEPAALAAQAAAEALAPARPTAPPPPAKAKQEPSPIIKQVLGLLREPQSAGTAFVLREVLDAPLSRRTAAPGSPIPPLHR
jgi:hypothetical protein